MQSKSRMGIFFVIIFLAFAAVLYTFFVSEKPITRNERAEERALLLGRQLIENGFIQKVYSTTPPSGNSEPERNLASQDGTPSGTTSTLPLNSTESNNEDAAQASVPVEPITTVVDKKIFDGELGRDPWGAAFHFQLKGDGRPGSKLYIWSNGANGQADFKKVDDMLKAEVASGDDILVSITL